MSITLCTKVISNDIAPDCSNPLFNGMEEIGYIINKSEIASYTQSGNIVSAITMAVEGSTTKKAFKIYNPGKTPFTGTKISMQEGKVSNKFSKTVSFVVPAIGPGVCTNIIDKLANGEFVVILASKYNTTGSGTDNAKFQIYGWNKGMKASAIEGDIYSEDTDGGWAVTMVEENVPQSGIYFYVTSEAASRTALEALC